MWSVETNMCEKRLLLVLGLPMRKRKFCLFSFMYWRSDHFFLFFKNHQTGCSENCFFYFVDNGSQSSYTGWL